MLVAAMMMPAACSESALSPMDDVLVVRVVEDTVAAQLSNDGKWVSFETTLELHNRSRAETVVIGSCGTFILTDALLPGHSGAVCGSLYPLRRIAPGEILTIRQGHVGCLGASCGPSWEFEGIAGRYRIRVNYSIDRSGLEQQALGDGGVVTYSDTFILTND